MVGVMKLKEYLIKNKINQQDFAKRLGIHYMHVNRIVNGRSFPSRKLALKIESLTDKNVSVMELLYP